MTDQQEPRELSPVQLFWDGKNGTRDFGPRVERVEKEVLVDENLPDDDEIEEAEEAMTPIPKDSPVQESVPSPASPVQQTLPASETPVPLAPPIPTQVIPQDADSESGKPNEKSEDESQTESPKTPSHAPSSPSSSTETSPGKSTPPAVAKPPTSA